MENLNFVWGCMTSSGMGYMCKIEGKMTQARYLSMLQDGVMETIERCRFNPSRGNHPKHTAKLDKQ